MTATPPPGNDNGTSPIFGVTQGVIDGCCGAILGLFEGAHVPPVAGCLICAAVIGEAASEMSEADRERIIRSVELTIRGVARWQAAKPEGKPQ